MKIDLLSKIITTKRVVLGFWLIIVVFLFTQLSSQDIPLSDYPELIAQQVNRFGIWSPLIFISLFAIRPLIFFPATLLSLSAGVLFGPIQAVLILIVAENLSSAVSYTVGRYFGKEYFNRIDKSNLLLKKFDHFFHQNDFVTILTLRLLFAPFDLLGYYAGASNISYIAFASATFLGILPGLFASAFLGGSISDPRYLLVAFVFIVFGIGVSQFIKSSHNESHVNSQKNI